jgi:hypothetical protein
LIDVKLEVEKNTVTGFAINFRTSIGGKFFEIYRVDTEHGFLHEQKFWLSGEPMPVSGIGRGLKEWFDYYLGKTRENSERYKKYYLETLGEREWLKGKDTKWMEKNGVL